ncbi:MAG: archease [Candidatus Omnitrophica bacterium]|nr:archease [Candidatus Omnitrophota bacterium]
MKHYEFLEHTADIGIRVWGDSFKELFIHSAKAMYELIADINLVKPESSFEVRVEAKDRDELLRNWLSELLYYFNVKEILLTDFVITELDDTHIISTASGEKIDPDRHNLKREIKAVTFHNLNIKEKNGEFATEIIFDI